MLISICHFSDSLSTPSEASSPLDSTSRLLPHSRLPYPASRNECLPRSLCSNFRDKFLISSSARPAEASSRPKGKVAMFQAKRTKNILKNRFLLSEKRVNMNTETTSDQVFTESALTPPLVLNTRVVTDTADRDLLDRSTRLWLVPRCAFCGRAAIQDGVDGISGWRGEANLRLEVRQCTRQQRQGGSWPGRTTSRVVTSIE